MRVSTSNRVQMPTLCRAEIEQGANRRDRTERSRRRCECGQRIRVDHEIGRGHVGLELLDAGRARYHHHLRQAQQPGQRDLRGLDVVSVGDTAQGVQQGNHPAQILPTEQRAPCSNAARTVLYGVFPAEQALGQRGIGDDDPVLLSRQMAPGL